MDLTGALWPFDSAAPSGSLPEAAQAYVQHRDQLLASGPIQLLVVKAMRHHALAAALGDELDTAAEETLVNLQTFLIASLACR